MVCCVFSLESPHQGDSNKYMQYTIFSIKKKMILNYPKSAAMGFFQGTQEQVRNSHGKQAISVRATEGLQYFCLLTKAPVTRRMFCYELFEWLQWKLPASDEMAKWEILFTDRPSYKLTSETKWI